MCNYTNFKFIEMMIQTFVYNISLCNWTYNKLTHSNRRPSSNICTNVKFHATRNRSLKVFIRILTASQLKNKTQEHTCENSDGFLDWFSLTLLLEYTHILRYIISWKNVIIKSHKKYNTAQIFHIISKKGSQQIICYAVENTIVHVQQLENQYGDHHRR